jgi:excisionase family DNA binding protein
MEAIQSYPNLLSEKQAAARLGVARITLLRAREAGRIRFFRIGTRVLYCDEHLTEFLKSCERNGRKHEDGEGRGAARHAARRKDNQVSASRRSVSPRETAAVDSATASSKVDQESLPFSATR